MLICRRAVLSGTAFESVSSTGGWATQSQSSHTPRPQTSRTWTYHRFDSDDLLSLIAFWLKFIFVDCLVIMRLRIETEINFFLNFFTKFILPVNKSRILQKSSLILSRSQKFRTETNSSCLLHDKIIGGKEGRIEAWRYLNAPPLLINPRIVDH